jgi:hypothetical protein
VARAFYQHAVVEWSDDGAREAITAVKTHSVTACRAVDLNLSSIGGEAVGGIFGGDTALERKTTDGDVVLCQSELLERGASGDLDLRSNNIDTRDLFGDRMLDLTV